MKKSTRSFAGTVSLMLCIFSYTVGQTAYGESVPVGGKVPDLGFTLWTGDSASNAHLRDFKGKLVLLDFWSTGCESCVAGLPDMLKLQEAYGDRIKIIEVGGYWDDDAALKAFWKKMEGHLPRSVFNAARKLPFIKVDSVLHQLFPHYGNGYAAWIDGNGIYKGMGTLVTLTEANIDAVLQGKESSIGVEYAGESPERSDPMSWLPETDQTSFSFFTNRLKKDGLFGQTFKIQDTVSGGLVGLSLTNQPIAEMYKLAYTGKYHITGEASSLMSDYQIVPALKDNEPLRAPGSLQPRFVEWAIKNLYSYAVKIADSSKGNVFDRLINDLDNHFNYQSSVEYRKIRCLILLRMGPPRQLFTKGAEPKHVLQYPGDDSVAQSVCVNCPFYMIPSDIRQVVQHNLHFSGYPTVAPYLVNETGYALLDEIDYALPNWYDIKNVTLDQLRQGLHTIGLDLVVGERVVQVLVIKDRVQPMRFKSKASSAVAANSPSK